MIASKQIQAIQDALKSVPCRIVPTSFEAEDAGLAGFPIHPQWRWDSCAQALFELKPHGVMMRLPLFWQLEVPLWYACRAARAPIFLNDPENIPVGVSALQLGGMDTVVTEQRDASTFADCVQKENGKLPQKWIVIHRAEDIWNIPALLSDCKVAQEVHLFPGLPILSQCPMLMVETSGIPRFHITKGNRYEPVTGNIETLPRGGIPSFELKAPPITGGELCACGELTYTQTV